MSVLTVQGDAAVGKTSLVHYMANGTFKPKDYSVATDGIDLTVRNR